MRHEFFGVPCIKLSQRIRVLSTIARSSHHKGFNAFVKAVMELWKKWRDFKVRI